MKTIEVHDNTFEIPKEHRLSETKRRLHIRTAWMSKLERLCKDGITIARQLWMRSKEFGDKPYVPEGSIEIDGQTYKMKHKHRGQQTVLR